MIRISAKDFAEFLTGKPSRRRTILRKYLSATREAKAQIKYYAEARHAIREYLRSGSDASTATSLLSNLRNKAETAPNPRTAAKLQRNVSVFESYLRNLGQVVFDVLPNVSLRLAYGDVVIGATPDLRVKSEGREAVIKLDLGIKPPRTEMIDIVSQVIFEAANTGGLGVRASDVIYLDAIRGELYRRARARSPLTQGIMEGCRSIQELWREMRP